MWVLYAFGSAFFAYNINTGKSVVSKTDSNVATAIRTIVVLIFSWIMVFVVKVQGQIAAVSAKTWIFLVLSGQAQICHGFVILKHSSLEGCKQSGAD